MCSVCSSQIYKTGRPGEFFLSSDIHQKSHVLYGIILFRVGVCGLLNTCQSKQWSCDPNSSILLVTSKSLALVHMPLISFDIQHTVQYTDFSQLSCYIERCLKWPPTQTTCLPSKSCKTVERRLNSGGAPEISNHTSDGPTQIAPNNEHYSMHIICLHEHPPNR